MAVASVEGDNEDKPMSAADRGQMVAMAIGGALGPGVGGVGAESYSCIQTLPRLHRR